MWLMLGATLWSVLVFWLALFRWDSTRIGSAGAERPWMVFLMIVASGVSSFVALWMLRDGSQNTVRIPLWLAVFTGLQGIMVTACAAACLVILWRARLAVRFPEIRQAPTRRSARR